MMLQDLSAVGLLNLGIASLITILGEAEDSVVVLVFPVVGVAGRQAGVFGLVDIVGILLLDALDVLLGLDSIVFRERTRVALLFHLSLASTHPKPARMIRTLRA